MGSAIDAVRLIGLFRAVGRNRNGHALGDFGAGKGIGGYLPHRIVIVFSQRQIGKEAFGIDQFGEEIVLGAKLNDLR